MNELVLRPYQQRILDSVIDGFDDGKLAQVLPLACGAGKTEIALAVFQRYRESNPNARAWFVVGTRTLLRQAVERAEGYGVRTGIIQAENTRNEHDAPFVICSVHTMHRRDPARLGARPKHVRGNVRHTCQHGKACAFTSQRCRHEGECSGGRCQCVRPSHTCACGEPCTMLIGAPLPVCRQLCKPKVCAALREEVFDIESLTLPDIVFFDEVHYAYEYQLRLLRAMRAAGKVSLGLTATPYADHMTHYHDSPMVASESTNDLTNNGYLVPMLTKIAERQLYDMELGIKPRGRDQDADFDKSQLESALHEGVMDDIGGVWKTETQAAFGGPVPTIVTAPTISECEAIALKLTRQTGLRWEVSSAGDGHQGNPKEQELLARFESGETIGLVSPIKLTIGFDAPFATCAMLLRPYATLTPFVQAVGRVLRTREGKSNALVLDFGTNFKRLYAQFEEHYWNAPREFVDPRNPLATENEPVTTTCPKCGSEYAGRPRVCPECGASLVAVPTPRPKVEFIMKKLRIGSIPMKAMTEFGWRWAQVTGFVRYKRSQNANKGKRTPPWFVKNRAAQVEWMLTAPAEHFQCFAATSRSDDPRCLVNEGALTCFPVWAMPNHPEGKQRLDALREPANTGPGKMESQLYKLYMKVNATIARMGVYGGVQLSLSDLAGYDFLTVRCPKCRHFVVVEDLTDGNGGWLGACLVCENEVAGLDRGERAASAFWDSCALWLDEVEVEYIY